MNNSLNANGNKYKFSTRASLKPFYEIIGVNSWIQIRYLVFFEEVLYTHKINLLEKVKTAQDYKQNFSPENATSPALLSPSAQKNQRNLKGSYCLLFSIIFFLVAFFSVLQEQIRMNSSLKALSCSTFYHSPRNLSGRGSCWNLL